MSQKYSQDYNSAEALLQHERNSAEAEKGRNFYEKLFKEAMDNNNTQAELNRRLQLYSSNTAYQRQVADMKKAGLNPYLAYAQGGAPIASGSSVSTSATSPSIAVSSAAHSSPTTITASGFNTAMNNVLAGAVNTGLDLLSFKAKFK